MKEVSQLNQERREYKDFELEKLGNELLFQFSEALKKDRQSALVILEKIAQKIAELGGTQKHLFRITRSMGNAVEILHSFQNGLESFDEDLEYGDRIFFDVFDGEITIRFAPGKIKNGPVINFVQKEEHAVVFVELFPSCVENRKGDTLESLEVKFPTRHLMDSLSSSEVASEGDQFLKQLKECVSGQTIETVDKNAILSILNSIGKRIYELIDQNPGDIDRCPAYKDHSEYKCYRIDLGNGTAGQRIIFGDNSGFYPRGVWALYFPDSQKFGLLYRKAFAALFPNAQSQSSQESISQYYSIEVARGPLVVESQEEI